MFSLRSLICFLGMFVGVMSSANAQFYSFGQHYNYGFSQQVQGGPSYATAPATYAAPQAYYRVPVVIYPSGQRQTAAQHYSYGQPTTRSRVRTVRVYRISRPAPVVQPAPVVYETPTPSCGCCIN